MSACDFHRTRRLDDGRWVWTCERCGQKTAPTSATRVVGECPVPAGLGDWVKLVLRRFWPLWPIVRKKKCGGCDRRQRKLNAWFPMIKPALPRVESCEVVVLANWRNSTFWKKHGETSTELLRENGVDARAVHADRSDPESLVRDMKVARANLVINRAFLSPYDVVEELAGRYPKTLFLTVNHQSQADLGRSTAMLWQQANFIRLARTYENCLYAAPNRLDYLEDVIWLPNVVRILEYVERPCGDPPIVSISCRWHPLKNVINQIYAVAILSRKRPIRLALNLRDAPEAPLAATMDLLKLDYEVIPWLEPGPYDALVASYFDVGLQVSFTEASNTIAIQHMLHGKPVVGSKTIRYLPSCMQVQDPDDPEEIAEYLDVVLDNWKEESQRARQAAVNVARVGNHEFVRVIREILATRVGQLESV